MQNIHNISITDRAAMFLKKVRTRNRLQVKDLLEFGYISSFTNADGSTAAGFRPGYMASRSGPPGSGPAPDDLIAHLADGTVFHFMPKFSWDPAKWYVVDVASEAYALFSIAPVNVTVRPGKASNYR